MVEVNGWKVVAIIFIILFIAETAFVYWAYTTGTEATNNEVICSNQVCYPDYTSFIYDYQSGLCQCYLNGKIAKELMLK